MFEIFGVPSTALFGQLLLGLINGSFYALLSIGLAVIFGLLNIINFAHGAQYTAGAFLAWMLLNYLGVNYWAALVLVPLIMAAFAIVVERVLISRTYRMDHLYGLLLTFGLALLIEGGLRQAYGVSGLPYTIPKALTGGVNLGFMFLPWYRGWAVVVSLVLCLAVWVLIEKTRVGAMLRAATENPTIVRSFGINPELIPTGEQSSEGLLAEFAPYDDVFDPVNRVLLPRADIATETLAEGLRERGWEIDDVTAYSGIADVEISGNQGTESFDNESGF